jgi:hypothetical protein
MCISHLAKYEETPFILFRDSSADIATGYDWMGRVRFPAVQDFSLLHSVQTDSGAHPAS